MSCGHRLVVGQDIANVQAGVRFSLAAQNNSINIVLYKYFVFYRDFAENWG